MLKGYQEYQRKQKKTTKETGELPITATVPNTASEIFMPKNEEELQIYLTPFTEIKSSDDLQRVRIEYSNNKTTWGGKVVTLDQDDPNYRTFIQFGASFFLERSSSDRVHETGELVLGKNFASQDEKIATTAILADDFAKVSDPNTSLEQREESWKNIEFFCRLLQVKSDIQNAVESMKSTQFHMDQTKKILKNMKDIKKSEKD